jgi:hypothetical protein
MGLTKNGVLGTTTGKLKYLVYYELGCKNVVRVIGERTSPPTAGEKLNMGKMRTLMALFSSIKPFLRAGFSSAAHGTAMNYHNLATSINRLNLVGLAEGIPQLEFNTLQLSMGNALMPQAPAVTAEAGELRFSWSWDQEDFEAAEDQVMLMAYLPDQNTSVFETAGAKRSKAEDFLAMQPSYLMERLEVFISFIFKDRSRVSNSMYLGRIN